jgi:hypothetical protein
LLDPWAGARSSFRWNSPALDLLADNPGPGKRPALETREYDTLAQYSQATGQDSHSVMLDCTVFGNVPRLDARDIPNLQRLYKAKDLDFSLVRGAAAIDRGLALPNVTNGFAGSAPDLGALESGAAAFHYGPRTQSSN